jgi:hypothetical protein
MHTGAKLLAALRNELRTQCETGVEQRPRRAIVARDRRGRLRGEMLPGEEQRISYEQGKHDVTQFCPLYKMPIELQR